VLVNDLARLVELGDFKRCLQEARHLWRLGGHDTEAKARIQAAICRCSLELTDFFAAAQAGDLAIELAEQIADSDLLGFILIDLGTARGEIRLYQQSVMDFERFLTELPSFTAARCMEGTVLRRLATVLQRNGKPEAALIRLHQAQSWFYRYGDEASATETLRCMIRVHLELKQFDLVMSLLEECERYALNHQLDREFLSNHLLDRAIFQLTVCKYDVAVKEGFQALEAADGRIVQQCQAHLVISQAALALDKPKDALSFAMAARVAAIDARRYDLEFEASEILFRLLKERGTRVLKEIETDYYDQGVDIFHYISEQTIRKMQQEE